MSSRFILVLVAVVCLVGCRAFTFLGRRPHAWQSATVLSLGSDESLQDFSSSEGRSTRQSRLAYEKMLSERFATGEELRNLRHDIESLRQNLQWAEAMDDDSRVQDLKKAIRNGENRDPDAVYKKAIRILESSKRMPHMKKEEREALSEKWTKLAEGARKCMPRFNLEGLWVGDYKEHGMQLVNITYEGDTLIARKVTGDENVPRGAISFKAYLDPKNETLGRIKISREDLAGEYERYGGEGQVSRRGFRDSRYVDGNLILVDDIFSFVWVPMKYHVSFTRPSPETLLRLLRDTISREDELENQRDYVTRCFDMDMTTCLARQHDPNHHEEPLRRIPTQNELSLVEKSLEEGTSPFNFFKMWMWRDYINKSLDRKSPNQ